METDNWRIEKMGTQRVFACKHWRISELLRGNADNYRWPQLPSRSDRVSIDGSNYLLMSHSGYMQLPWDHIAMPIQGFYPINSAVEHARSGKDISGDFFAKWPGERVKGRVSDIITLNEIRAMSHDEQDVLLQQNQPDQVGRWPVCVFGYVEVGFKYAKSIFDDEIVARAIQTHGSDKKMFLF